MLIRKLFRTAWCYKAQFLSMVVMVAIGMGVFLGFNIEWKSVEMDTGAFFEETNYADFRLYKETGFSRKDVEKIGRISQVEAATRFLCVNVDVEEIEKSAALMVSEDYTVSTMRVTKGMEYDPEGEGIWLSDQFAEKNGISIGDELTFRYKGMQVSGQVAGLCKAGEMMICTADENQLMPDFNSFGFAYITPKKLKSVLGIAFYPQINLLSSLEKEEMEEAVRKALGQTIMVVPKEDHTSYAGALSETQEGKAMGSLLPVLFLAIGILTMVTTMHRIAANEKTQIGALKALGFRDRRILLHYTSYGLVIGVIGTSLGAILGYGLAAIIISPWGMMSTYFDMPDWSLYMPSFCLPVMLLTVALLSLICFLSVRRMQKGTAADALRPYTPKAMKESLFEKMPLWEKLSFGTKWNFRDILRHKVRSLMTLIGVVGCMLLLVGGLGMKDTMDGFLDVIDHSVSNYKTKLNLSERAKNKEGKALAEELQGDWGSVSGISYEGATVTLEIYDAAHGKIRFINEDNEIVPLTDEGVYLCLRLRDTAAPGEEIQFSPYGSEEVYKVKVAGYLRSVMTENMVMTAGYADKMGIPYRITNIYTDK
ncbi:MAG: ABC transporter permease, partial [Eubacteriales bacterium]|nr:ABC transporter permease [Eubacteriales bacterium]